MVMEKCMKVKMSQLVNLFQAVGYGQAPKWDADTMGEKIGDINELIDKDSAAEIDDEDMKSLLKKIKKAIKEDEEINLIDDRGGKKAKAEKEEKPSKKAAADDDDDDDDDSDEDDDDDDSDEDDDDDDSDEDDDDDDSDEDEDSEDDDEDSEDEDEEEEKPKKRGPGRPKGSGKKKVVDVDDDDEEEKPKKRGPGRPKGSGKKKKAADDDDDDDEKPAKKKKSKKVGVIAYITQLLTKAGENDKPITEKKILDKLEAKFPDNERASMRVTFRSQVPYRFKKVRDLHVHGERKTGMWIDPNDPTGKKVKKSKKTIRDEDE
jgi:hypothetical protein